ncbi:MAG: gamma-glutamyl-gamma-aminobutyrate hydrolase family protein [Phocaeicola plebeius]|nr:gamma-glutamyl-gamma-aminobutyrate hydrolase family protein [Phocaeicola plebeius]
MKKRLFMACLLALGIGSLYAQRVKRTPDWAPALAELYRQVDSLAAPLVRHQPLIGISCGSGEHRSTVNQTYVESVIRAGGIPYVIPVTRDASVLRDIASRLDGMIFTGGEDISPAYYGSDADPKLETTNPYRDVFDLTLLKLITDRNIPVLGICRGLQLINVGRGGTLYQDLPSNHPSAVNHRPGHSQPTHPVHMVPDSRLQAIVGSDQPLEVNSMHHQGIRRLGFGLRVTGWAADSIPEVIEAYPHHPILAVQFHPEVLTARGDTTFLKFFRFLVSQADTFRKAKDIHRRIFSVDTHTDTPLGFRRGAALEKRGRSLVSLQKMDEGHLDAQFLAAFIGQGKRDDASLEAAVTKVENIIRNIYTEVEKNKAYCGIAVTEEDMHRLKAEGKKAFFIGIENGYGVGKDLQNIRKFKGMGVNYITLCHSYDNDICHSSTHTEDATQGLTPFGREVVKEMNRQGIMIDLSHASEGTFWEVLKVSTQPVICSHSSARALCDHDRNLTDDQLRALAQNGGVVQLCLLDAYIHPDRAAASVSDAAEHLDHMIRVAGIDHVGIGSDFDGGGGLTGCYGDNDLINLTVKLLEKGYTEEDLRKVWGGNLMRVMNQVQQSALAKSE